MTCKLLHLDSTFRKLPTTQGNRTLKYGKTLKNQFNSVGAEATSLALAANIVLYGSVSLENIESQSTKNGRNFWRGAFTDSASIFTERYIQNVMLRVLNAPVIASPGRQIFDSVW